MMGLSPWGGVSSGVSLGGFSSSLSPVGRLRGSCCLSPAPVKIPLRCCSLVGATGPVNGAATLVDTFVVPAALLLCCFAGWGSSGWVCLTLECGTSGF